MHQRTQYAMGSAVVILTVGMTHVGYQPRAAAQGSKAGVPIFEVDPAWPRLPDNVTFGQVSGLAADANNHVWVVSRPNSLDESALYAAVKPPVGDCCIPAPAVAEFDENGKFLRGWGGPGAGYEWPESQQSFTGTRTQGDGRPTSAEHGVFVDHKGNIWTAGNASTSHQILKFTPAGKFLLQVGRAGQSKGSNDTENLNKPTGFGSYAPTNELFVSDGYGNRRVIVFDADTGKYKRHWGAYGNRPDDSVAKITGGGQVRGGSADGPPPQQFNTVHGIAVSKDGHVYAADRANNRIQVFKVDGTFVREAFTSKTCLTGNGSAYGAALSGDPQQQFLYVADGCNGHVVIFKRDTMERLGQFGRWGRGAGQFYHLHSIATDPKGNIYTGESLGYRAQKFTFKGLSK